MGTIQSFRDLDAWKTAMDLALTTYALVRKLPAAEGVSEFLCVGRLNNLTSHGAVRLLSSPPFTKMTGVDAVGNRVLCGFP